MVHNHYSSPFLSTIHEPTIPLNSRSFSLEVGRLGAPATLRMPSLLLTSLEGLGQLFTSLESLPSRPDGSWGKLRRRFLGMTNGGFPWWKTMIFSRKNIKPPLFIENVLGLNGVFLIVLMGKNHTNSGHVNWAFNAA